MAALGLLLFAIGAAPLALGAARLGRSLRTRLRVGSVILCALAFNLTFFWQELWLVIPKALTPGLHPVLYHNDHDWTGHSAAAELLQGTGALATLASGLAFGAGLAMARRLSPTWRLFLFWMAFEGLYQSLMQLAVGALVPGNDVGRALAYLHAAAAARWSLLALAVAGMALAGVCLARRYSGGAGLEIALTAMLAIAPIIPFRVPRGLAEVVLIPLLVNLAGAGWTTLGASIAGAPAATRERQRVAILVPSVALCVTLLLFQLVLRRGLAF